MRLAVTGAGGFVGRALARRLGALGLAGQTLLIDRQPLVLPGFACLAADLSVDPRSLAVFDEVDAVCHLAGLPGAAAEADPVCSRRMNLDLPLALIERLAGKRLVYASSIAVYGTGVGDLVDDGTAARPASVYGTHKRMVELAFADAIRRHAISGVALRLPGVVARPPGGWGFGSAFLSDLFHAARAGTEYTVPVGADATTWIVSTAACARQLAHALLGDVSEPEPLLLPATRASLGELVAEAGRHGDAMRIDFRDDPGIRRLFASHPPLEARRARALGFESAESLPELVESVFAHG